MPDPERWLPRYERSNWKAKGRKDRRNRNAIRGPQGSWLATHLKQIARVLRLLNHHFLRIPL